MQYIFRQPLAILLPAFALLLTLPGCGGLGKMEKAIEELNLQMDPEPLVLRGDEVQLNLSGTFPAKYFAKNFRRLKPRPLILLAGAVFSWGRAYFP